MTDPATKRCNTCGHVKPLSEFHRLAAASDGRQYTCKQCRAGNARRSREANPEAARERQARYREANREALRQKGRQYASRPEVREQSREKYEANLTARREQMRQYYQENRDVQREQRRRWYEENAEETRARVRNRAAELKAQVFSHYGLACACCGTRDDLSIDHVNGDGRQHREELFGRQAGSSQFYYWLVQQGFPSGYQVLCRPCNASKRTGKYCRLRH